MDGTYNELNSGRGVAVYPFRQRVVNSEPAGEGNQAIEIEKSMRRQQEAVMGVSGTFSRATVFVLAAVVTTFGVVSLASGEGGNVRYSWEQVSVGDDATSALVPLAEGDLSGDVDARTVEQAFEHLRRARPDTYGNSYASVSGDPIEEATAEVHIDSNYAQFSTVIKAEAVYTLTEYGVPEVKFPDFADEPLTRADVAIPAYTLTVPLWRVVPSSQVTTAQILMPDGELVSVSEVEQRWQNQRDEVIDDVYAFLSAGDAYTVQEVAQRLGDLGDLRIAEITPLLTHDDDTVRETALSVLEGNEDDATALDGVYAALDEESDAGLARKMAEFLGRSGDDEFNVVEQFYLLEEGDDDEAAEAIRELANWDDDQRVVDTLVESLVDEREDVAEGAVESMDALALDDERIEALDDEEINAAIRMAIAEDLTDDANEERVRMAGFTHIAHQREGGYANQALREIAALQFDDARQRVEEFLEDDSRQRRHGAMEALMERNDVESIDALMALADDSPDGDRMLHAAYEIMVSQSLDDIIDQTDADSTSVQEVAYRAIGERAAEEPGRDDAVETVEQGADHQNASIRAASAESLGEVGTDEALEVLSGMTNDQDAQVRRSAALALGQFSGDDEADTLVDLLDDADPQVVAAAIDALEMREDDRAASRIEDKLNDDEGVIRASALRAVTTFLPDREEATVSSHINTLGGAIRDDATVVQKSALEQLGRFEESMAVTNIANLVGSDNTDIRLAALEALAATGHDDARSLIESALNDSEAEVRRQAVEALTELIGSEARQELEARMEDEEDPDVRDFIQSQLQSI